MKYCVNQVSALILFRETVINFHPLFSKNKYTNLLQIPCMCKPDSDSKRNTMNNQVRTWITWYLKMMNEVLRQIKAHSKTEWGSDVG